ncbi:PP2A regulatory subunit TAP46-like isoform X2 [Bidens hawaiensis]|uniref:PP2A regulatory subunit TAP46-like isoform X2 n=1 Tax=Bidens hawaiensis TaxID=980011 RepID=UPI00404AE9DA
MGSMKMEDMSLPALFEQARKIHILATDSAVDKETLRKGCEALQQCEEMISKLGLFSSNETKEEISTTNLKYILVPFYLAELIEKTVDGDRIQILKASLVKLKVFLLFCDEMELVPEGELETGAQNTTAIDKRAKKIARFKRQRAAESKLLELKERKERRGRSTRAAALSTPVDAGDDDVLDDDGEEEREAWLTTISLSICKALDLMEMLTKEEEMLSAIKEKQEQEGDTEISQAVLEERAKTVEDWHRNASARARYTKPAAPITCATFAQDVLEGRAKVSQAHDHKHQPVMFGPASLVGGSITSERERIAAQVFQPGHRLPTMSIEEAGLKEMEMMNKWQERTAKMIEEANSSWHNDKWKPRPGGADDDEDDEDDEAAQDKARAFDDWKDENPRGAGNSKLTPCG